MIIHNQLKTDTMGQVAAFGGQNPDLPCGKLKVKILRNHLNWAMGQVCVLAGQTPDLPYGKMVVKG